MGLTLAPVMFVVGYDMVSKSEKPAEKFDGEYKELFWGKLREFDYTTGRTSADLEKFQGQRVAIPGFIVPLDDDAEGVSEFLLVPSPKACIHVPPPPPNQMVLVRMKGGQAPRRDGGPVWIKGIFRMEKSESGYGDVSFVLLGEIAEKYEARR